MNIVYVLQHVSHETLGSLERFFRDAGVVWREVPLYRQLPAQLPWRWDDVVGLVVLGGPMNVDEVWTYPFLQHEVSWIERAASRGLPVLGICLGAQLLAKSLGARVYANSVKEIGWYDVELAASADDPLFGGLTGRHTVFQWHGDTFDLPRGAVRLARGSLCQEQAFRWGAGAYGLQFHVEVTAEMVTEWLAEAGNQQELRGLDYIDPTLIRSQLPAAVRRMEILGQNVLSGFAQMCRQRGESAATGAE